MTRRTTLITLALICLTVLNLHADAPPVEKIVNRALDQAGGAAAFAQLGVLQITMEEQENLLGGGTINRKNICFVDARNLVNLRMEMRGDVVIVRNGDQGWAQIKGEVDQRPQSPRMAKGTLNQRILPLLFPFTFTIPEVRGLAVVPSSYEGTPSWRVALSFGSDYFTSPSMNTTWHMEFARDSGKILCWEFQPAEAFSKERKEGVRYTVLRTTEIDGVTLPLELLVDGIDRQGHATGHTQAVTLSYKKHSGFDPALFIHPERLEAIEEGMAD